MHRASLQRAAPRCATPHPLCHTTHKLNNKPPRSFAFDAALLWPLRGEIWRFAMQQVVHYGLRIGESVGSGCGPPPHVDQAPQSERGAPSDLQPSSLKYPSSTPSCTHPTRITRSPRYPGFRAANRNSSRGSWGRTARHPNCSHSPIAGWTSSFSTTSAHSCCIV